MILCGFTTEGDRRLARGRGGHHPPEGNQVEGREGRSWLIIME